MTICNTVTREPKQKRSIEKKKSLLDAGLRLITEKGLNHINSKDIAKEAGVSIGSFYAYFKDKHALFYSLVETYKVETTFILEDGTCDDDSSPSMYITSFLTRKLESAKAYPAAFHREIYYQRTRDNAIYELYESYKKLELKSFNVLLISIIDYISIEDIDMTSLLAFNIYEEMISSVLEENDLIKQKKLLNEYIKMFNKYLFN